MNSNRKFQELAKGDMIQASDLAHVYTESQLSMCIYIYVNKYCIINA